MSSPSNKDAPPYVPSPPTSPYPVLPSYEEAMGAKDQRKLPSYRPKNKLRFHPYRRPVPELKDGTGIDRYYNTIYDEERIDVIPPPALPYGPLLLRPLVGGPILDLERLIPRRMFRNINGPPNAPPPARRYPQIRGLGGPEFEQRYGAAVADIIMQEFLAASTCRRTARNGQQTPT